MSAAADEAWEKWAKARWPQARFTWPLRFEGASTVEAAFKAAYDQALIDAADAIQALHPGEVKNSVIWLKNRAKPDYPEETPLFIKNPGVREIWKEGPV